MIQDRRQFQRLIPDPPLPVCLNGSLSEHLFDLCEGGLSIHGLPSASQDQPLSIALDLPGASAHIRARAEVIWAGESQHRTGLRLLDLDDISRQQLRMWISSKVHAGSAIGAMDDVVLETVTAGVEPPPSPTPRDGGDEVLADLRESLLPLNRPSRFSADNLALLADQSSRRLSKLRAPVGLIAILVLVSPLSVFLGHFLASRGNQPSATRISATTAAAGSVSAGSGATVMPAAATTATFPASLPFDLSGFILQVGAMSHENNADVLRESLERKNFPAFVFKRSNGQFYRVAVGPYSDTATALKIKDQLEGEGFEAIIRRWSPQ